MPENDIERFYAEDRALTIFRETMDAAVRKYLKCNDRPHNTFTPWANLDIDELERLFLYAVLKWLDSNCNEYDDWLDIINFAAFIATAKRLRLEQ